MDEQNEIEKPESLDANPTQELLSKLTGEADKAKSIPEQKPESLTVLKSRH